MEKLYCLDLLGLSDSGRLFMLLDINILQCRINEMLRLDFQLALRQQHSILNEIMKSFSIIAMKRTYG